MPEKKHEMPTLEQLMEQGFPRKSAERMLENWKTEPIEDAQKAVDHARMGSVWEHENRARAADDWAGQLPQWTPKKR